ncbi:MAG TPA: ABC transporter permease [Terriglobia bacterium]|nr:ABC transporter permease [Terriglobia bacterium]
MKFWTSLRTLLAYVLRHSRVEHEMEEELRSHVDTRADDLEREGLSRAEAERQARVEFGGYERYKEECREALGSRLLGEVAADTRHGLRMLARKPGFAAVVILTLGLGIGANTAMFSIVDAVLLKPLPYKDPERLVVVWATEVKSAGPSVLFGSYRDFEDWQRSARSFAQLEALTWATAGATLEWHGQPRRALAIPATQGIFPLLGVKAAEGRTFQPEDLARGCTVVLAHRFWQEQLGSARDVVAGTLTLDGKACTVVGLMPQEFDFYPKQSDLWTLITPDSQFARQPIDSLVGVSGRLKPGVSRARAQAELTVIHQQLVRTLPKGSWLTQVAPVVYDLQSEFTWLAGRNLRIGLSILFAAVVVVLLIACLNVASLFPLAFG